MVCSEAIVEKLRAQGERLTVQRQWVIDALCARGDHLTVHQVQAHLAERGAPLTETTVYRILQWLKERGIVAQTDLGQSGVVYQVIDREPHHHLVCLHCGQIIDLDDRVMDGLRAQLRRDYDFEPRIDHMAIFGVCHACREHNADTSG